MSEKRGVILNSLLTLILAATIYQFFRSEYVGTEIGTMDRGMQRTQQQIGELREIASSTFEQTIRRLDDFSRQLRGIAPALKANAPAPANRASRRNPSVNKPVSQPSDERREQEAKLNRDLLQFSNVRARVCNIHANGRAVTARDRRCSQAMLRLAKRGNTAAQEWVGAEARGTQHDLQTAIFWLERAANQSDSDAMNQLGAIYAGSERQTNQNDTLVDPTKALYWYGKSAGLEDPAAMGAIAAIYREGRLVAQNQQEAITWYELAAKATNKGRSAWTNYAGILGDIYNATGVEQDKALAFKWYAIACSDAMRLKTPRDPSCTSRDRVANELSPIDLAKAQVLAAEWEKSYRQSAWVDRNRSAVQIRQPERVGTR